MSLNCSVVFLFFIFNLSLKFVKWFVRHLDSEFEYVVVLKFARNRVEQVNERFNVCLA